MGVKDDTGECIIATSEGTVKARDFKRFAESAKRWDSTLVKSLQGTPWQPTPGRNEESIPVKVRLAEEGSQPILPDPGGLAAPKPEIKRRARISRTDVIRVGFTVGCPGCTAINRGEKEAQNHTEECRTRIEKALIEEGGIKGKRMMEGNQRYSEHQAKKTKAVTGETGDNGLRPGESQTLTGHCGSSGNAAVSTSSSSGLNRQGVKRGSTTTGSTDVQPDNRTEEEQVRKYQRQEDEEDNQEEGQPGISVDFQPDKEDSDCMFVEKSRSMQPNLCQVQGGDSEHWDDISGKLLNGKLVAKARQEEMG